MNRSEIDWLRAVRAPEEATRWPLERWAHVIRQARRLRLLGRLAESVSAADLLHAVPPPAARHLVAEQRYARWRSLNLTWAIERLSDHLGDVAYPVILLKGAAYIAQDLSIGRGRLPSDLDVMVPRAHIGDAQRRLLAAGWKEQPLDAHDQRYYHEWSHEVPPMRHPLHGLELDLHHNILPPIARTAVNADLLLEWVQPSGRAGWSVLHPVDQVLHSAAHLFLDAELEGRLRDLVDMDGLMRHFGASPGFWDLLPARAATLGLGVPLALACDFCQTWLDTPVPAPALQAIRAGGPGPIQRAWLRPALRAVLYPSSPDALPSTGRRMAAGFLLARYHLNRMPMRLLLPHLWHKWRGAQRKADAGGQTSQKRP